MSLAETQELMRTMQELMVLLNNVEAKTVKLTSDLPKIKEDIGTFREAERLALRYLALARKMHLPEHAQQAAQIAASVIVIIRMLQMSMGFIGGGGLGALIGFAGIAGAMLSVNDLMQMG
jgi:hypothetical protein